MTLVLSGQIESLLAREAKREGLTPEAYAEVLLRRVLPSSDEAPSEAKEPEKRPRFGSAKGKISIADDFDDPLEELQEYMY